MPYCSQCGSEVAEGHRYCQRCGAPLDEAERAGTRTTIDLGVLSSRSKMAIGLLVGSAVLALAAAGAAIAEISVIDGAGDLEGADNRRIVVVALQGMVGLGAVIAWLMWQHRTQSNVRDLGIEGLRFTPGWAVGWWFIPIANLWQPSRTVSELWRASTHGEEWTRVQAPKVGWWWVSFLASRALVAFTPRDLEDVDALRRGLWLSVGSDGTSIVAALLAISVVVDVWRGQRAMVERQGVAP